jgi:GntR family transcriptional regulator
MLDPHSGIPLHRQLADLLRARITSGEWPPGRRVPSETTLGQEYQLGRGAVRAAIAILRAEGLVDVGPGRGTRVRERVEYELIDPEPGSTVWARPPTPVERREYDLPDGVWMLVVEAPDGIQEAYPGDVYRVRFPPVT